MHISDILTSERTFHSVAGQSKKRIFEFLASELVEDSKPAHMQRILDAFMARERLGSTGLGQGIAIPHCRLESCTKCVGALLTLRHGIDFDAPDKQPVDVLFVLMVPGEATDEHLQILAELAKRFSNPGYCESLRNSRDAEDLYLAAIAPIT